MIVSDYNDIINIEKQNKNIRNLREDEHGRTGFVFMKTYVGKKTIALMEPSMRELV